MTLSIAQVPTDILLEFAKELDIADLLSFLSLCRSIRKLRFQRALWLDALIRICEVQMQPLPLLTAAELDVLSLLELQNVVQQAHRLMENLQSSTPLPIRIRTFSVLFRPNVHGVSPVT
ncbi:hypothetical protein B0H13DRAFT_2346708 [Mycena leptocephala]|nr:hypothetical protein B0H13DRAFT_2346708 [Mycena leptocephala]